MTPTRPPRTYGSATCDGLGILLLTGSETDDDLVKRSVSWIEAHPDTSSVPGFTKSGIEIGWPDGLKLYYYAALSRALPQLAKPTAKRIETGISKSLIDLQHQTGKWQVAKRILTYARK